jgi:MFS family permease
VKAITRNILVLSVISLFNDVASEMLYPVMPVYLKSIGFSVVLIGVLEGCAEITAGLSKGYFGNLSDNRGKRLPFVRLGYGLSALSKPIMAAFVFPIWVFFARTLDKLGKGVRTGARDALLSDEATKETKATVFGFHRAMDTLGAVIGPSLALLYLVYYPADYRALFLITFFPGLVTVALTFLIREKQHAAEPSKRKPGFLDFIRYWKESPAIYRKLVTGLLLFALFNSSDMLLLLKIKEAGFSDKLVIGVYIFYNLVYAIFSYPLGVLADKIGMKKIFITGLLLFVVTYAGMAFASEKYIFFVLFFLYGIYAAATEGIAKAWITNVCHKKNTATAIGTLTAFQSVASLLASSLAGFIWYAVSAQATFLLSAGVTLLVAVFMSGIREE